MEPRILHSDLTRSSHQRAVIDLINEYRADPMGGRLPLMRADQELLLINGLCDHPTSFVLLCAIGNEEHVGLIVGFWGLSTFQLRPQLNIHDLVVMRAFRRQGLGKALLESAGEYARGRGCCRVTLEVRADNVGAQGLYRSIGFKPCDPAMEYWLWPLEGAGMGRTG